MRNWCTSRSDKLCKHSVVGCVCFLTRVHDERWRGAVGRGCFWSSRGAIWAPQIEFMYEPASPAWRSLLVIGSTYSCVQYSRCFFVQLLIKQKLLIADPKNYTQLAMSFLFVLYTLSLPFIKNVIWMLYEHKVLAPNPPKPSLRPHPSNHPHPNVKKQHLVLINSFLITLCKTY